MLAANKGKVRDYRVPQPIPAAGPTHLAIPTTAGTGSEVTRFTVITDSESGEKMLLAGDALLPTAAVVDYELTLTMPPRLTADTGTDSLTHAIEAFVSRRANPFTDALALSAMKTIWRELPTSFRQPGNAQAREAMMLAATQAGIAFSNASVALVHGMSRPLGAFFHIPHGLSNAMLLPAVTAFSVEAAVDRYAECARTMGLAKPEDSDEAAADQLIRGLYSRNAELQVPTPRAFGIPEERYIGAARHHGGAGAGLGFTPEQPSCSNSAGDRADISPGVGMMHLGDATLAGAGDIFRTGFFQNRFGARNPFGVVGMHREQDAALAQPGFVALGFKLGHTETQPMRR